MDTVVEVNYSPTTDDFRHHLKAQITKHCTFNEPLAGSNHDDLIRVITSHAQGMLLLACLHINAIAAQYTSAGIKSALKKLPTDIKHTYERAIQRIPSRDKALADRVLMWLTFAERPLTTMELRYSLAVGENLTTKRQTEDYMYTGRRLLDLCEGLVVADHPIEPCTMRLIHPTAQAYFEAYFDSQRAHKLLATTCLQYLSYEDMKINI